MTNPTRVTIARDAFNAWHLANHDVLRDNNWIQFDPDDDGDAFDALRGYLTACTDEFSKMMLDHGVNMVDADSVTFDPNGLVSIEHVADCVYSDYEGTDGRNTDMPDSPWVIYGLGGDDDVDYNGSYIGTAIMLMRLFSGLPITDGYPHIPHAG